MIINLKRTTSTQGELSIQDRLPPHIEGPCHLSFEYLIEPIENYYLLSLSTKAQLQLVCQRCLQSFSYPYANQTSLIIFTKEAEVLASMRDKEYLIAELNQVDLRAILTDELHLYSPEYHPDVMACGGQF